MYPLCSFRCNAKSYVFKEKLNTFQIYLTFFWIEFTTTLMTPGCTRLKTLSSPVHNVLLGVVRPSQRRTAEVDDYPRHRSRF